MTIDEDLFGEMKRYVGFGEPEEHQLRALGPRLTPHFQSAVDDFYAHILGHEGARSAMTGGDAQVARLKGALMRWLADCFTGPWDTAYFDRHARTGHRHVQIRLPQHYMFVAMSVMRARLLDVVLIEIPDRDAARAAAHALNGVLDLELAIMLHAYREASQAELIVAKEQAEQATRAKSDFLANMSHEIRTPMNAVIGLAHLALRTELTSKQRDYLSKIHNAGTSLLGIINDILDFSKVEAGRIELETTEFDLEQLLAQVNNVVGQKAHDKGLELLVRVSPGVPSQLVGDPLRLGQIVTNLVNNAVKFTERGEVRVVVALEERTGNKVKLRFSVEDTGMGMTPEQSARLFQPFTQADTSTTRKHGGTGLGLTISKRLVELMGGQIGLDTEQGVGTSFHFSAWLGLATGARRRLVPSELARLRVLVADDNAAAREIMTEALHDVAAHVDVVASGAEAVAAVRQSDPADPYDVVFMDWRMPGMDGLEASARIKRATDLRSPPRIVMVTAFGREEMREDAERLALDGLLLKPVTRSTLVDSLTTLFAPTAQELSEAGAATAGLPSLAGTRVLLVEDNEINQQIAIELLESAGATVTVADNGRVAVELLEAAEPNAFDVVLMDMQMPEMDGHEATARIRADERFDALPIIAMTAHATVDERQRCFDEGMVDHVAKPVDPELLIRTVARHHAGTGAASHAAPPSTPRAAATPAELGPVPGLDTTDGLRRLGGNATLYRKLLTKLVSEQRDAASRVAACIAASDREGATRVAHTLKGVAGNLGAKEVQRAAAELEVALTRKGADAGVDALVAELDARLGALLGPLAAALGQDEPAAPQPVDPAQAVAALAQLRTQLSEFDAAAADTLDTARGALAAVLAPDVLDRLHDAVQRYAFDDALTLLDHAASGTQEEP